MGDGLVFVPTKKLRFSKVPCDCEQKSREASVRCFMGKYCNFMAVREQPVSAAQRRDITQMVLQERSLRELVPGGGPLVSLGRKKVLQKFVDGFLEDHPRFAESIDVSCASGHEAFGQL